MGTLLDFTYLAEFFLEQELFQTKIEQKIKTHILCAVISPHPALKVNSICRGNYWGSSMWIPKQQVNY